MPIESLKKRPPYEGLDATGSPQMRVARVVGELHHSDAREALDAALPVVSAVLGLSAARQISYGLPLYEAFGLKQREAARHEHSALLKTHGSSLSLDYVPIYQQFG
ncbi:hypothetical protein FEV13_00600 (plasmid) [Stutzerimonas degradans]|nr:hypothetical protein FEV13_00600 [Stutzerimonas degradans]